jgi:hypothetical protein
MTTFRVTTLPLTYALRHRQFPQKCPALWCRELAPSRASNAKLELGFELLRIKRKRLNNLNSPTRKQAQLVDRVRRLTPIWRP